MKILFLLSIIYLTASCLGDDEPEKTVGGQSEIDVNEASVEKLLDENLKLLDTGDSGSFKMISKTKVTQQVVSGMAYKIYGTFKPGEKSEENCVITIWSRPWLQDSEAVKIKAECGADSSKLYKAKNDVTEW